jgi:nucleoside permease NupC
MLATGFMVFLGIALILAKLPRRLMLRALHHSLALDLGVTLITLFIHWGSFDGVMAATVAGLLTSLATSGLKRLVGHIRGNMYYPGLVTLDVSLKPPHSRR